MFKLIFLGVGFGSAILYLIRKYQSHQNKSNNKKLASQLESGDFNPLELVEELKFLVMRKKLPESSLSQVRAILDNPPPAIDDFKILNATPIASDAYVLVTNCHTEDWVPTGRGGHRSFEVIENINFVVRFKAEEIEIYSFLVLKDLRLKNMQLNFCTYFLKYAGVV